MVYHAWIGQRRTRGWLDFFVAGRSLGGVTLGISFFATYASTNSYVGFSGQAYSYGLSWLLLVPFAVGFTWMAWIWVAPRLRERTASLGSVTIPDFIGFRFASTPARVGAALLVLFSSVIYMTAVFKGIGNLLEAVLEVPYWTAIGMVLVVVMLYTAVGGFHSVVRTDVIQGGMMIVAAVVLFTGTYRAAGGWEPISQVVDQVPSSVAGPLPLTLLLGVIFATTIKALVEPRQLSRFYALEDERAVRQGTWISPGIFLLVFSLLTPVGAVRAPDSASGSGRHGSGRAGAAGRRGGLRSLRQRLPVRSHGVRRHVLSRFGAPGGGLHLRAGPGGPGLEGTQRTRHPAVHPGLRRTLRRGDGPGGVEPSGGRRVHHGVLREPLRRLLPAQPAVRTLLEPGQRPGGHSLLCGGDRVPAPLAPSSRGRPGTPRLPGGDSLDPHLRLGIPADPSGLPSLRW